MMTLKIDLYTDIICPWCLIGNHRLDKVLAEEFADLAVDIDHHPVMLMPDTPVEGIDTVALMKERYGGFDRAAIWDRPEAEARASGLTLDLSRQPTLYPTLAAHTLVRVARARGTQHALAVALGKANFLEIRNIADPHVLADIAADHGFDRDEALALIQSPAELEATKRDAAASSAKGVRGVPHFLFGETIAINGGQSEAALAGAIRQTLAKSALLAG